MNLKQIISEIYSNDDIDEIFTIFSQFKLDIIIEKTIVLVDENYITNSKREVTLSAVTSYFIINVNSILKKITDIDLKRKLEVTISDISTYLFGVLLQKNQKNAETYIKEIKDTLISIYVIEGYNYEKLKEIFKIHIEEAKYKVKPVLIVDKLPYYDWKRKEGDKDILKENLVGSKYIKSKKEFEMLFAKPKMFFTVRFDIDYLQHIIILFDLLHEKKIIKARDTTGHFSPLEKYAITFDSKPFIEKDPKFIKSQSKKNITQYNKIRASVSSLISHIKE